jgi:hypothetical protein
MKTDELIDAIVMDLKPVTPLAPPARRAFTWLVGSALYCTALALYSGGAQIALVLSELRLWLPQVAAVATALVAAFAAFASVVPGHSQRIGPWLVVAAAAAWIAVLLVATPPGGGIAHAAGAGEEWECVRFIAIGGLAPLAALVLMLRRGAPLHARGTAALAAVASGTLLSLGACVARPHGDGAITLLWHGGAIVAVALVCIAAAGGLFTRRPPRPARAP